MMDNEKNKGSGEFEETFDDDFSDAGFDEAAYDEDEDYSELSADEEGYEGDDFESEDWGDADEEADAGNKKTRPKSKSSSGGLSFNTIVIIGAVVLGGGVMAFNIMRETSKQQSAETSVFQSILNIGGIMDGTLFGEEESGSPEQSADASSAGFMNDPSGLSSQDGTPPQPVPLAPVEGEAAQAGADPLTPMPEVLPTPPRGPEESPPTEHMLADDSTPSEASALTPPALAGLQQPPPATVQDDGTTGASAATAEDILKQAMANREQKQQEQSGALSPAPEVTIEPEMLPSSPVEEISAPSVTEQNAQPVVPVVPVQQAVQEVLPPVASAPLAEEDRQALAESRKTVAELESRLDSLLERMGQIESDLDRVRTSAPAPSGELEKAVAALRADIADIKARPSSAAASSPEKSAPKKSSAAPKKAAAKPAAEQKARSSVSSGTATRQSARWELRAAQPGRAWVSKAGDHDMQAVSVGDSLQGIGRVNAITYQNGRWAIVGTQGTIQQ